MLATYPLLARLATGLLLALALCACGSGSISDPERATADPALAPPSPEFPLLTSPDGRYLIDSRGVPFPILGRAAWSVTSLKPAEFERFLDDTRERGFNAVEVAAINTIDEGNRSPFDGDGNAPFLRRLDGRSWNGELNYGSIVHEAADFTTPNESFWAHVDQLLDDSARRGIAVLLFPAYVGYAHTHEGWMDEMVANGPERMHAFGAWIATRYRDRKNIIWMIGGDQGTPPNAFSPAQLAVEQAFVSGLTEVPGQASQQRSALWSGPLATSEPHFESCITLDGAYAWARGTAAFSRQGYAHAPVRPAYLLEEPYDEEGHDGNRRNSNATQPVRRFEWWGWLGSIGGYVAGNAYVWPFLDPWWHPGASYKAHLDTQNTRDLAHLNRLIRSLPWYQLVPDGLGNIGTLVSAGRGKPDTLSYVAAAATPDGRLLVAYAGPASRMPFTIDLTKMRGTVSARWFNPTTGTYVSIGSFPNDHAQPFVVPGKNGTKYSDWALILTSP
jgi:hypothetical protein